MQVVVVKNIREDAARGGVVLEVIQHAVDLIELALRVDVLDAELIAVGLADGAVGARPAVPDMAAQLGNFVGLFLPDPQKLLNAGLVIRPAQRHNGEFLAQVVAVHHAELLDGMRGRAVLPMRADGAIGVPHAVV